MNFILFFIFLYMLYKAKNILTTIIVFFILSYFIEVIFVNIIHGVTFSERADLFGSLDQVTYSLSIFMIIFYIFNNNLKDNIGLIPCFKCFKPRDFIGFFILGIFFMYIFYTNILLNTGGYKELSISKTPLAEYLIPIFTIMLILSKGRFLIVIPFVLIAILYGLSGERLKMFMYLFILYLIFKDNIKFINFKVLLIFALILSSMIGLYRSGLGFSYSMGGLDIHRSHFGELSISSMYLIEFSETFSTYDKIRYLIGIFLSNIVPSSMLPINMDIKRSLIAFANIPGGGWLPVWFFSIGGYILVALSSLLISLLSKFIHTQINTVHKDRKMNLYAVVIYIMFLSTANNWLMYNPYQLFKFPLYAFFIMLIIYLFVPMQKVHGKTGV